MYSLVKFEYGEYFIAPLRKVKVIDAKNCLVKYKNSGIYEATLIKVHESEEKLKKMMKDLMTKSNDQQKNPVKKKKQINNLSRVKYPVKESFLKQRNEPHAENRKKRTKIPSKRLIHETTLKIAEKTNFRKRKYIDISSEDKQQVKKPTHSTPLKKKCTLPNTDMRLSDISKYDCNSVHDDEKTLENNVNSQSNATSAPPSGASELLSLIGDSWLQDSSIGVSTYQNISDLPFDGSFNQSINGDNLNKSSAVNKSNNHSCDTVHSGTGNNSEKAIHYSQNKLTSEMSNETSKHEFPKDKNNSRFGDETYSISDKERKKSKFVNDENSRFDAYSVDEPQNILEDATDPEGEEKDDDLDNHDTPSNITPEIRNDTISQVDDSDADPNYTLSTLDQNTQTVISNKSTTSAEISYNGPAMDIRNLKVVHSKCDEKRKLKQDFCIFCKKLHTKLSRHLIDKHKIEPRVKEFMFLTKGSKKKKELISKIRKDGNFLHNTDPKFNTGILITCRQQQSKYENSAEDYVTCSECKGCYSKKTIRLHFSVCNLQHKKGERGIGILGRRKEGYAHPSASEKMRKFILPVLNDDEIVRLIKYDELIILMGNKLCEKLVEPWQHDQIRSNLRYLGRIKQVLLKKDNKFVEFSAVFHPENYDLVVKSIQECAQFDPETETFAHPSVATTMGTLVKKTAKKWVTECIKKNNIQGQKDAENFLKLYDDDYGTSICKTATQNQMKKKRLKKVEVPEKDDISKLYKHVKKISQHALEKLQVDFDLAAWKSLCESTLILVQIFNRKRAGEIERIEIADFDNRVSVDKNVHPDFYMQLSEIARELTQTFVRVTIRGKLGRTVPVLLDKYLVECITNILKYRRSAGVKKNNSFVFGIATKNCLSKTYLRACHLMRKFSEQCGAKNPRSLRGTELRKHLATYTAMMGIDENQITDLANFMGHNKQIHKDIYRVPVPMKDITDVSRFLMAAIETEEDRNADKNGGFDLMENDPLIDNASITEEHVDNNDNVDSSNDEEFSGSAKKRSTSPYGKTKRRRWSNDEKAILENTFGNLKELKNLPSLAECQKLILKNSTLKNRTPQQIKSWLDNQRKMSSRNKKHEGI